MKGIREFFWNYPNWVLYTIRRFKVFFGILFGFTGGALIVFFLFLSLRSFQENRLANNVLRIGFVGQLHHINPLDVGAGEAEKFVTSKVFNSLISINDKGEGIPELAETWELSPDGTIYTFFLKRDVEWQDGVGITASDVIFTLDFIKSAGDGSGIGADVSELKYEATGPYQIKFTLPQVNAAFLELMDLSIIPEHIYKDFTYARFVDQGDVVETTGSGQYLVKSETENTIVLEANPNSFMSEEIEIPTIEIITYPTLKLAEAAFLKGDIHILSPLSSSEIESYRKFESASDRFSLDSYIMANNVRVLLFNYREENEFSKSVKLRTAVARAIDKEKLVKAIPGSIEATGPYSQYSSVYSEKTRELLGYAKATSHAILEKEGWKYPYSGALYRQKKEKDLEITLTFLDSDSNREVAQLIREDLGEIGVNVTLNGVTGEVLQQKVISEHKFELLLFEIHTGIDPDQYNLWHSSQKDFPGLNIAGLDSSKIDTLLEKGRLQNNRNLRESIYIEFQEKLLEEVPTVFLYHPSYFELSNSIVYRELPESIINEEERFTRINSWYFVPGWRNWQTR